MREQPRRLAEISPFTWAITRPRSDREGASTSSTSQKACFHFWVLCTLALCCTMGVSLRFVRSQICISYPAASTLHWDHRVASEFACQLWMSSAEFLCVLHAHERAHLDQSCRHLFVGLCNQTLPTPLHDERVCHVQLQKGVSFSLASCCYPVQFLITRGSDQPRRTS